ncbi:MAG: hypothetical protein GX235_10605 [Clostridiales bacterium]|nr:hypothetical protein [Clostridiales bacterium]
MEKQLEGQINLFDFLSSDLSENPQKSEEKPEKIIKEKITKDGIKKGGKAYFLECKRCWCFDCSHNTENEAVPRDFVGEYKPCPSCAFCVDSQKAEPCEIGSYDNGCKVRASEEGISVIAE